jgi:hypothetical protein
VAEELPNRLQTLPEVDAVFEESARLENEAARLAFLTAYYYDAGPLAAE